MKLIKSNEIDNLTLEKVKNLYTNHVSSSQVKLLSSFEFGNDLARTSKGIYIYTEKGKKIYDFTGGFGVLNHGHNHDRIINVRINFQKKDKIEVHKNYLCPYLAALSSNISKILPGDLNVSYLPNSGAEANEGAIKLAYKYHNGNRKYLLHSDISFHGKLLGTGSISSSPEVKFKFPGLRNTDEFKWNDIDSLKTILDKYKNNDGKSDVFAIIIEPFSASSLLECSEKFLRELRTICTNNKIVLIFDEIYTGWGKTGEFFYFMRYEGLVPDVLTMSKSFGGGKSSISCFTTTKKIFEKSYGALTDSTIHSTTYNAFGEESITALEAINIAVEDNYPQKAKIIGEKIFENLKILKNKYPKYIKEIRGKGCLQGILFNSGPNVIKKVLSLIPSNITKDSRFIDKLIVSSIIDSLYAEHDILTSLGQNKEICLWISPPIIVNQKELDYFFSSLDKILKKGLSSIISTFIKNKILRSLK
tara:strand:+ start:60 stop:1484 length:1425 start_codon:yes stop_codon:yes gene_type:complete